MTELTLVKLSPTADSRLRWRDGCLKGMKVFKWEAGEVWSPLHRVQWPAGKLSAENFYTEEGLRGKGGIHAIWPPSMDSLECAALDEFVGYAPTHRRDFTALVAGWGRSVMGDVGWRAEHAALRTIISPPRYKTKDFRQWCREHSIGWSVL